MYKSLHYKGKKETSARRNFSLAFKRLPSSGYATCGERAPSRLHNYLLLNRFSYSHQHHIPGAAFEQN